MGVSSRGPWRLCSRRRAWTDALSDSKGTSATPTSCSSSYGAQEGGCVKSTCVYWPQTTRNLWRAIPRSSSSAQSRPRSPNGALGELPPLPVYLRSLV